MEEIEMEEMDDEEEAHEENQQCEFKFAWIALLDLDRESRN